MFNLGSNSINKKTQPNFPALAETSAPSVKEYAQKVPLRARSNLGKNARAFSTPDLGVKMN